MQIPTIHLNGTAGETLLEEYLNVEHALEEAINAMVRYAPHPRDYYVVGEEAWRVAREEHHNRLERLQSVLREVNTIVAGINAQNMERERTRKLAR